MGTLVTICLPFKRHNKSIFLSDGSHEVLPISRQYLMKIHMGKNYLTEKLAYYVYSQTFIREPPFGKPKLSNTHRWLFYQGSVRRSAVLKFLLSYSYNLIYKEDIAVCLTYIFHASLHKLHVYTMPHEHFLGLCILCFVALRHKSTAMVVAGWSVHLTTFFPG